MSTLGDFASPSRRRVGEPAELCSLYGRNKTFEELVQGLLSVENRRRGIQCPLLDLLRKYQTTFQLGTLPYSDERRALFEDRLEGIRSAESAFINRFVHSKNEPIESSLPTQVVLPMQEQSRLHHLLSCVCRRN